jgi:hypothetical protein
VKSNGTTNFLYIAKDDGSYYYVPQELPTGNLKFGDMDGDGLVDLVKFNGAFASLSYQSSPSTAAPDPIADPQPAEEPAPATDPGTASGSGVPTVDANAYEVESVDIIAEVGVDSVLLESGETLWFDADTIIKYNDASGLEAGQTLEFKAWANPDGALVGIKVEVAS